MRRHIDEDETPAANRQRNRAADVRHGFGSPEGMELTDRGVEQEIQPRQAFLRRYKQYETKEQHFLQALVDLDSPPPIQSLSTESETPTPPALTGQSDRQTPPNVADQLVQSSAVSPPRRTPTSQVVKPPQPSSRRRRGDHSVTFERNAPSFVSPTVSNISASSSANLGTPKLQPNSFLSPMALQTLQTPSAVRTATSVGSFDPIQMGTPRSAVSGGSGFRGRFSDVIMTPDRGREVDDSTSDSDTSVKEPFSDQVKSLNKLLLSTGKRLGALGQTNWTPDKDNDDLTKEEEDLEEIRRQLQQELSMVDYSVLKDSPTSSSTSNGPKSMQELFPDDEYSAFLSRESTPERNKMAAFQESPVPTHQSFVDSPHSRLSSVERNRSQPSDHFSTPSATPSSTYSISHVPSPWSPSNTPKQIFSPVTQCAPDTENILSMPLVQRHKQHHPSPPSTVLVTMQDPQPKINVTLTTSAHHSQTLAPQDAQISPSKTVEARRKKTSPTEISTGASNQSQSSSSTERSSKSLLERLGFRSSPVTPSHERQDESNLDPRELEHSSHRSHSTAISSSRNSMDQEDMLSTSASEDSLFDDVRTFYDATGGRPLLSPTNHSSKEQENDVRLQPVSAQTETRRRLEEQIVSTKSYAEQNSSPPLRREIAPEPPVTERLVGGFDDSTKVDYTVGTLRAQELLDSLDSLFFGGPVTPSKQAMDNAPQKKEPKVIEGSNATSSIGTKLLKFPSDEGERSGEKCETGAIDKRPSARSNVNSVPMTFPSDEAQFPQTRLSTKHKDSKSGASPCVVETTSFHGDKLVVNDEAKPGMNSPPSINIARRPTEGTAPKRGNDTKTNLSRPKRKIESFFRKVQEVDEAQASSPPTTPKKRGDRLSDSTRLLQTIGSSSSPSAQQLSPIVHEDDEKIELEFSGTDPPPKALFLTASDVDDKRFAFHQSKMPSSYRDETMDYTKMNSDSPREDKKGGLSKWTLCSAFIFVVIGVGVLISLSLSGVFGGTLQVSPTSTPSVMPILSSTPTMATQGPTSSMAPSNPPSWKPSGSPTVFSISFESVYEIIIKDGLLQDVPQETYRSDLIESMNRLLEKVVEKLPSESKRLRRRLTVVLLPSSINELKTIACPEPDSQDRCEKVYAWITLEDAKDSWTDFKLFLELAIAIGQLQFELDQVNPQSPVAIIDLIDDSVPSPAPSVVTMIPSVSPTRNPAPTDLDLFALLVQNSVNGGDALMVEGSPQREAYLWLSGNSFLSDYTEDRLLQRYALASFFFSTHGEDWFFKSGWLTDADECSWYSRSPLPSCNREGQIQNLEIEYNNINGALPPELGLLSNSIERLVLRGGPASFTEGFIPSELGLLTRMSLFSVRGNRFSGSIPTELGRWSLLQQFDVSRNNLTGSIPTQFGRFSNLASMDISDNRLTGQLPIELGNIGRCQILALENNMLTGPIPSEIGNLRRLQSFRAGSNILTSLPSELGRLTFMDTLSLFENEIKGTIPSEISRIRRLILLDLSDNAFTGTIPSQLGNLYDMRDRIDLSHNHLTGLLPPELGDLTRLRVLELHHNKLSGVIPLEIASLARVTTISLEANDLTGNLPLEVCDMFNQTYPSFSADCSEFVDHCPCCTTCCVDDEGCACRYIGTPQEFLCFQQKKN